MSLALALFFIFLGASVTDCLAWSIYFYQIFLLIFLAKDKNPYFFTNIQSSGSVEQRVIFYMLHVKVMFILFDFYFKPQVV